RGSPTDRLRHRTPRLGVQSSRATALDLMEKYVTVGIDLADAAVMAMSAAREAAILTWFPSLPRQCACPATALASLGPRARGPSPVNAAECPVQPAESRSRCE